MKVELKFVDVNMIYWPLIFYLDNRCSKRDISFLDNISSKRDGERLIDNDHVKEEDDRG